MIILYCKMQSFFICCEDNKFSISWNINTDYYQVSHMSNSKDKSSLAPPPEPRTKKISPRPTGKSPGITVRSLGTGENDGST